jgi:hypothetical protein
VTRQLQYIQFIGTQRSGSNLLRVMLNQLKEISAPHPPHILKTFFPLLDKYGNLQLKENFSRLVNDVCHWVNVNPVPWENFTLEPAYIESICERNSLIELFSRIYKEKALHDGASFWCCKSMESVYYVDEIEKAGLHPYYIYIYRDGRDVALSFMKAVVGPKHIYYLAKKWKTEQELSLQVKTIVDPSRFIEVRYEDLIHNPVHVMKHICHKLHIAYSPEVFEYFHSEESLITASSGKMWANLSKPIIPENFNKFQKELSEHQIITFERIAGEMLARLGYKTLHWPNVRLNNFSTEEIQSFKVENERLINEVLARADRYELEKRKAQDILLEQILNRV